MILECLLLTLLLYHVEKNDSKHFSGKVKQTHVMT